MEMCLVILGEAEALGQSVRVRPHTHILTDCMVRTYSGLLFRKDGTKAYRTPGPAIHTALGISARLRG